jgi:crotonobetainyl-CoA:carnitine CoA-transferase CaiB-like acyl-CoA transferase
MIAVAIGNDNQFARFAALIGKPEWTSDVRYAKNPDRVAHRETLDAAISQVLSTADARFWLAELSEAGIPCGRINSVAQALSDPHTMAREMVRTVQHPTAGAVKMLGIPFRFSDTPASIRCAPPLLGQHTEQVLRDLLQLSDARIADLRSAKVI